MRERCEIRDMRKIVTIVGTRPQFVKMPLVSHELKRRHITEVIIHTGQHYDKNMSRLFFDELGIPAPDYNLKVRAVSHSGQIAGMLAGITRILEKERPGLVLVYGDTNSTVAGAIAAAKSNIRIAHIEAGLRSFNHNMPEEVNRVITDSVSSIFFCPTPAAVSNLKREGRKDNIYLVGDVMFDSIKHFSPRLGVSGRRGKYILCTVHRAENTDNISNLKRIFSALGKAGEKVVMPLHPRTAKYLKRYKIHVKPNIKIIGPASYREMLELERDAYIIITDSGGVQKEAAIFGIPCVTLRNETEWVETVRAGVNFLAGTDGRQIESMIEKAFNAKKNIRPLRLYGDGFAYRRIAETIAKKMKERLR